MRKAKNVLSILGIVFSVLAIAIFILLPTLNNLIPSEGTIQNFDTVMPTLKMIIPFDFFDFSKNPITFTVEAIAMYSFGDWARLGILAGLAIFAVLFIIWLIVILAKKQPVQLLFWIFALIAIAAAIDVVICYMVYGFKLEAPELNGDPYKLAFNDMAITGASDYSLLSVIILAITNSEVALFSLPTTIFASAAFVLAALGIIFLLISIFVHFAWLKGIKRVKPTVEETSVEEAPVVDEPVVQEPAIAETESEPVSTMPVEEETPAIEEPADNPFKVVRRILVHKSGKVIRVLNEHYYDVTTDIYVEPGYDEPYDPNETEQIHYEKILNARGGAEAIKPEPKKATPVVAKVEEPAGEYERISFEKRIKSADKDLKKIYNELKSELISYGLKSRVSSSGDTFRLHTKTYAKMVIAGKSVKVYFALDPKDYKNSKIPFQDVSKKNAYKEIPFAFKVKSDLSVRRAKQLIADTMAKDKLIQGKVEKHDWIKDL